MNRLYRTITTGGITLEPLYDASGSRVGLDSPRGCRQDRTYFVRGADGKALSEFADGSNACPGNVLWLRDFVYRQGQLVATVENSTLAAPKVSGYHDSCDNYRKLDITEPEFNACRSQGVNVYSRIDAVGSQYDYARPLNPAPLAAACPNHILWTAPWPGKAGTCFVVHSVHRSGRLGPPSKEICAMPSECAPPLQFGCPVPGPAPVPSASETSYAVTDHLGTPRVNFRLDGAVESRFKLGPFGERLEDATSCGDRIRFTGHERDPETGLDYMMARYYSRVTGRFFETDPLRGRIGDGGSWNRYSYARNNPLLFVDPLGLETEVVTVCWPGGCTTTSTDDEDEADSPSSYGLDRFLFDSMEGWRENDTIVRQWWNETGDSTLYHGADSARSRLMLNSTSGQRMRQMYIEKGCPAWTEGEVNTFLAYYDMAAGDMALNAASFQVGGFDFEVFRQGSDTAYLISNTLSMKSFLGFPGLREIIPYYERGKIGIGGNVQQFIYMKEDGCPCAR